jgi:hypothetical protein
MSIRFNLQFVSELTNDHHLSPRHRFRAEFEAARAQKLKDEGTPQGTQGASKKSKKSKKEN